MQIVRICSIVLLALITIATYGFVDFSVPVTVPYELNRLAYDNRLFSTVLYIFIVLSMFAIYGIYILRAFHKKISAREVKYSLLALVALLLFSYPVSSNDIYNYIATSKVAFLYRENPYIVMPIEISTEPMLIFMHVASKTALYGPSWLIITFVPYTIGLNSLFPTLFAFKAIISLFFIGTSYLIYKLSNNNILSVIIFAFNPLVIIETLISSHNDIVMMFFALLSFYLLRKRLAILAAVSILSSIGIKFATVVLVPVLIYVWYMQRRNREVGWDTVWLFSALLLFLVFLLSPLREEMYPWYFQWVLVFVALAPQYSIILIMSIMLSLGLSFRFAPYIYTGSWNAWASKAKQIIIVAPLIIMTVVYVIIQKISPKKDNL